jgi:hypothetical protein
MGCRDTGAEHCCWIDGKVCTYLEEHTVADRRWVCGLFRIHGAWSRVYQTAGYIRDVKPTMDRLGVGCGEWPAENVTCAACDLTGILS